MIAAIEQRRRELGAICQRFGVGRLEVFGSVAAGRYQTETGDLDFLVEFALPVGPGYADRYLGLLEALRALFGQPVDLVVSSAITNPYFRESVDKTRALLYAA